MNSVPFTFSYPIYVIRVSGGYASLSINDVPDQETEYAVAIFTEEALADDFIRKVELEEAEVTFLRDERELARLLVMFSHPFTHIAWNPEFRGEETVYTELDGTPLNDTMENDAIHLTRTQKHLIMHVTWGVSIHEMLEKYMPLARTPWNYPVFFLAMKKGGYAGILTQNTTLNTPDHLSADFSSSLTEKEDSDRILNPEADKMDDEKDKSHTHSEETGKFSQPSSYKENNGSCIAVAMFTSSTRARTYRNAGFSGSQLVQIDSPARLKHFITDLAPEIRIIAINPEIADDGAQRCVNCLSREKMERYYP